MGERGSWKSHNEALPTRTSLMILDLPANGLETTSVLTAVHEHCYYKTGEGGVVAKSEMK